MKLIIDIEESKYKASQKALSICGRGDENILSNYLINAVAEGTPLEAQSTDAVEGTRDCKTCIHSDKGNCAYTEECHECMWESKYEQQPCEDCISRAYIESIVEELENICINGDEHILSLLSDIKNAPPVAPLPKGKWVDSVKTCRTCFWENNNKYLFPCCECNRNYNPGYDKWDPNYRAEMEVEQ